MPGTFLSPRESRALRALRSERDWILSSAAWEVGSSSCVCSWSEWSEWTSSMVADICAQDDRGQRLPLHPQRSTAIHLIEDRVVEKE